MDARFLLEVAKQLQGRYGCIQEIDRLTREAADAFSRNDTASASLLLKMRGECMEKADVYKERMERMLRPLEASEARLIDALLSGEETGDGFPEECRPEAVMVYATSDRSRKLLTGVILRDQAMNSRITGKKSFYREKG